MHPTKPPAIDGYEIDALQGTGGCGSVWRAREIGALRRTVAIKVLREDVTSPRLLARFHAERQILAALDHPGIVAVHAAGIDDRGRPWFAMPFVDGAPLTTAAESRGLTVEERVALLDRVAAAVEHAHQRGIIHRDLKPQNVLLQSSDSPSRLEPRIIDFGVAKSVFGAGPAASAETLSGQRIGTPGYMSPEQFAGQPVDTRADIWSLGVLMHELLTGDRPEQVECDSSDVWTGSVRPRRGFRPASEVARLNVPGRAIDSDLDAVVARCLHEDREGRYASVSQLRDDLARWMRHEPVSARVHSPLHDLALFLRRNRPTAIAVGAAFAVTAGLAAMALHSADSARNEALRAERELARARMSEEFATKFLVSHAGLHAPRRDAALLMRVLESLEPPAATADPDGPLAAATRHAFLGRGYAVLREWDRAHPHLEAAFGIFDDELPVGSERTIDVLIDLLRPRDAVFDSGIMAHARRHLAEMSKSPGASQDRFDQLLWHLLLAHPTTTSDPAQRAQSVARVREHLARLRADRPPGDEATLLAVSQAVLRCTWSGFPELGHADALSVLADFDSGRIAAVTPGLLVALSAGGYAAGFVGDSELCIRILERFGDDYLTILGPGHRSTFDVHNNAGFGLALVGREAEGIEVLKRALPWAVMEYGDSSAHAQLIRNNIWFAESRLAARTAGE